MPHNKNFDQVGQLEKDLNYLQMIYKLHGHRSIHLYTNNLLRCTTQSTSVNVLLYFIVNLLDIAFDLLDISKSV